jgi:polyisoprenoid-binding protein YceI
MMPRRLLISAAMAASLITLASCSALRVLTHATTTDPSELAAGDYRIDPDHVFVTFKVDHFGFSNYVGRFNTVDGALDFDPAAPEKSALTVVIAADSVDSRNAFIDAQLKGPALFDAENFPEIKFVATKIEPSGDDKARVTGELTLVGARGPAVLHVVLNGAGSNPLTLAETLGFSATMAIKRSDFGLSAWIPAVGDEVTLDIEAEFVRRKEP